MIIVTGCDNTGKTTLCEYLSKEHGIPIAKRYPRLPPINGDDWFQWCKEQIESNEEKIYDRFFIDELVYGRYVRDQFCTSNENLATLASMLVIKQPLYIYTYLPLGEILKTFPNRDQYITDVTVARVLEGFRNVNQSWPVKFLDNHARFNYKEDRHFNRISLLVGNYLRGGRI